MYELLVSHTVLVSPEKCAFSIGFNVTACAVKVCFVLDGGSQHSYITYRAKEVLGLVCKYDCQLAIAVFASKQSTSQPRSFVNIGMKTKDDPDLEF